MSLNPNEKVNLSKAKVLVLDTSKHAADILSQLLRGFGVGEVYRSTAVDTADKIVKNNTVDLIIADPKVREGDGYKFLYNLRHCRQEPLCFTPIILISGHSTPSDVKRARDSGANFFIAKPVAAAILLERVLWVARDRRPFVEVGDYIGPDRRFKLDGPPNGEGGRRANDAPAEIADTPETAQGEIDLAIKSNQVAI